MAVYIRFKEEHWKLEQNGSFFVTLNISRFHPTGSLAKRQKKRGANIFLRQYFFSSEKSEKIIELPLYGFQA